MLFTAGRVSSSLLFRDVRPNLAELSIAEATKLEDVGSRNLLCVCLLEELTEAEGTE